MEKLPNHTALKEWSSVVDALGRGDQVILIRKGGIADSKFGVEADRFYLYPTFYHQPTPGPEPEEVEVSHWCEVVRTWRVRDVRALDALASFVLLSREALETRYRFRPDQALHVIAVRTFVLPRPVTIAVKRRYLGCRSWVSVDDEIAIDGSRPAMTDADLQKQIDAIDSVLREAFASA
jgi:hypothetical protein